MTSVNDLVSAYLVEFPADASAALCPLPAAEIAKTLAGHPVATIASLIRRLPVDLASDALALLPQAAEVVGALDPARAAQLLSAMSPNAASALGAALSADLAEEIRELQAWPSGTAGAYMDARVLAFSPDMTAAAALLRVRDARDRRVSDLVVVDDDGRLVGTLRLQDVVGAPPETPLHQVSDPLPLAVQPLSPRDEVVTLLREHRLASLPVVDLDGKVVGILRQDAMIKAAEQDAIAGLQQAFGGRADERALTTPWAAVRSRHPWLQINLVTAFLAAAVVGVFEETISQFTALAILLPVVAGQSGNTGAQALAVTIRGLALREVRNAHGMAILRKELVAGFVNGVGIAAAVAVGVWVWSRNDALAAITAVAMIASMTMASVAGAAIPLVLVALRRDPATASSIVLTTITDVVGFASFLGLATLLSSYLAP